MPATINAIPRSFLFNLQLNTRSNFNLMSNKKPYTTVSNSNKSEEEKEKKRTKKKERRDS